ncbi:MAG: ABC transporter permease [Acidimicrobiales bacterium]|nr:ABC transporter permease [Acidimicrobiales bacterium]
MSLKRMLATGKRVLLQLKHDPRTVGLLLLVPTFLTVLLYFVMYRERLAYDRVLPELLALFPYTTMFVVASVAMVRERTKGTLERLMVSLIGKGDLLVGYALAFGLMALVQTFTAVAVSIYVLGVNIAGGMVPLLATSFVDAVSGMALGLMLSAFATSEFQAVQFLPAVVLPQFLLCGLIVQRNQLPFGLHLISDVLPLSYAADAGLQVSRYATWNSQLLSDLVVVGAFALLSLGIGAVTLKRSNH